MHPREGGRHGIARGDGGRLRRLDQLEDADSGELAPDRLGGAVGAPVAHDDDLEVVAVDPLIEAGKRARDDSFLVVSGDDHAG